MRRRPIQEVQHPLRLGAAQLLVYLGIFALLVTLVAGNVRLYELKEENRLLEEQLAEYEETLAELKQAAVNQESLYQIAVNMGLSEPKPEEIRILRVRSALMP